MKPTLLSFVCYEKSFWLTPMGVSENAPSFLRCECVKVRGSVPPEYAGWCSVEIRHVGDNTRSVHYFPADTIVYI